MTEDEAKELLKQLSEHYKQPVRPVEEYCDALQDWAKISKLEHYGTINTAIHKSCLLDRTIYLGEKPSLTPCPVHKGVWSGIHWGWPDQIIFGRAEPSTTLQEWHDKGCRCYQHSCGCTTGWQPDFACGCGEKK